jgi:Leucine-rich repeat (LRR) protein
MRSLAVRSFDRLDSLETLNLSDNDFSDPELGGVHPAAFSRMPSLQVLDMGFSGLYGLHPNAFDGTPRLAELYLPGNNVSDVAAVTVATSALPSLRVLDLSRNGVTGVQSGVFKGHHNLESLYLDRSVKSTDVSPAYRQSL